MLTYQKYLQIQTVEALLGGLAFLFIRQVPTMHLWVTQHHHFNDTVFDMVTGYGFWGAVYGLISLSILRSKDTETRRDFAKMSGIAYTLWFPVFLPSIIAGRWQTLVVIPYLLVRGAQAVGNSYFGFFAPNQALQNNRKHSS